MTDYTDGGPAFPWGSDGFTAGGLSIRDWFAGQAPRMPEWFMGDGEPHNNPTDYAPDGFPIAWEKEHAAHHSELVAFETKRLSMWAYSYADAMLSARQGGAA